MDHQYLCKFMSKFVADKEMWIELAAKHDIWFSCSENAGLLALTRVGSRRVVQISAGFMIFFSILG